VTINARNEEEVDSTIIIDKVAKSTGSVYKFNERIDSGAESSGPVVSISHSVVRVQVYQSQACYLSDLDRVKKMHFKSTLLFLLSLQGTVYKRTIPKQEINSQERDKFWEQQEQEERARQETERRRREEDKKRLEVERQKRDSEETAKREAKINEAAKSINQIRLAEKESFGMW